MSKARDIADLDFNSPDIDGGNIDGATLGANTVTGTMTFNSAPTFNTAISMNSSLNVASTIGIAGTTVISGSKDLENIRNITTTGNVGIGQFPTSFTGWQVLDIKGGSDGGMVNFEDAASNRLGAVAMDTGNALRIQTFTSGSASIKFEPNNSVALTLDSNQDATFAGQIFAQGASANPNSSAHAAAIVTSGSYGGGLATLDTNESGWYQISNGADWVFYHNKGSSDTPASKAVLSFDSNGDATLGGTSNSGATLAVIGQYEESSGDGYDYNIELRPNTDLSVAQGKGTGILFCSEDTGSANRHAAHIQSARASTVASNYSNNLIFSTRANGTEMTEKLRILAGGGITFNKTNYTANAFDYYEEGTWNPTVSGGNYTFTYQTNQRYGEYTRIGDTVHAWFLVGIASASGSTDGAISIGSLPFTAKNSSLGQNGGYYGSCWKQLINTTDPVLVLRLLGNSNAISVLDGSSNYPDISPINASALGNDRRMRGYITYKV